MTGLGLRFTIEGDLTSREIVFIVNQRGDDVLDVSLTQVEALFVARRLLEAVEAMQ